MSIRTWRRPKPDALRRRHYRPLLALALAAGLVLPTGLAAPLASAQTPATAAVYNGTSPHTAAPDYLGITRALRFQVTNRSGDVEETNNASGEQWSAHGMDNAALIDVDQMASPSALSAALTLTNTTDSAVTPSASYLLPEGRRTSQDASAPRLAVSGPARLDGAANLTLSYDNDQAPKLLRLTGTLGAGSSATVTVPLTLTNLDTLDMSLGGFSGTYASIQENDITVSSQRQTRLATAWVRFVTCVKASNGQDYLAGTQPYLGTVLDKKTRTYTTVPAPVQALMPAMSASDFVTEMVNRGDSSANYQGVVSNFMSSAAQDTTLYSGSLYYLDLTRIKAALAGSGWSVNNLTHAGYHNDTDQVSDVYAYQTWGRAVITDSDGQASQVSTDRQYVELYQDIEAHDLSLWVGDSYSPQDTLTWIRTYDGQGLALDDPRVSYDASAVDTSAAGVYPVTYTYQPRPGGETVTRTIHVTVRDRAPGPTPTASSAPSTASPPPNASGSAPTPSSAPKAQARSLARTGTSTTAPAVVAAAAVVAGALGTSLARHRRL